MNVSSMQLKGSNGFGQTENVKKESNQDYYIMSHVTSIFFNSF